MRRPRRAAVGVLSPRRAPKLGKIRRRACLRLIPLPGTGDVLLAPTQISHPLAYVTPTTRKSSLTSSLIGVGITRTDFCDELLSNSGEGTITSSSSTFLPLTSFERKSFSRKDPFLATNILPSDL